VTFVTLDLSFSPPPFAMDTTCSSTSFLTCTVSQTTDMTVVSFRGGPGLAAGVDFQINLQGFSVGETVNGVANVPEPATLFPAGLGLVAIIGLRRARR
jgi:hypothetical protein